ncbi:Nmad2 family putative nucleotide modification protein [Mesorhizobium sp. ORM8.1]
MSLHSYVVRYDSGFAPNPFYGFCTLATCKPDIRQHASIGDWVVGCGSGDKSVRREGQMVYAMLVTETLTFDEYDSDLRFSRKKPYRTGSRKQSCGDNIYSRTTLPGPWAQRDSFHSLPDGTTNPKHVTRDTGVNRVLVSDKFVYYGGNGPKIPQTLRDAGGRHMVHTGRGRSRFDDVSLEEDFKTWLQSLGDWGYQGPPFEWLSLRRQA